MTDAHGGLTRALAMADSTGWEVLKVQVLPPRTDASARSRGAFARYDEQIGTDEWSRGHGRPLLS